MAHDPQTKARAVHDLLSGMSVRDTAKKYKIAAGTVGKWSKEMHQASGTTAMEVAQTAFEESMDDYGVTAMQMCKAQCAFLMDPVYLKTAKVQDVIAHTKFLLEYLYRLMQFQEAARARDRACSETGIVRVEAEIVEE